MPTDQLHYEFRDFSGGLNDDDNPAGLRINEFAQLLNAYWRGNNLRTRMGYEKHPQTTAITGTPAITGLYDFVFAEGDSKEFVCVAGTKIYKDVSNTWTDITGAVTITAGQNNVFTFTTFKDTMVATNGVDVPIKWTGTGNAAVLGGSPPTAPYIYRKWNRLFLTGHSGLIIRYSALGDHETWAAGNTITPDSYGDEYVTGLGEWRDYLMLLTNKRIVPVSYTGDETAPFAWASLAPLMVGCVHQRAFANIGDDAVFMSDKGIHSVNITERYGDFEEKFLSYSKIKNLFDGLAGARRKYAIALYYPPEQSVVFLVSDGGQSSNQIAIWLDLKGAAVKFSRWDNFTANAACIRRDSQQVPYIYFGNTAGQTNRFREALDADAGAAFNKTVETPWVDLGEPAIVKYLRYLETEMEYGGTYSINVDIFYDYNMDADSTLTLSMSGTVSTSLYNTAVYNTDVYSSAESIKIKNILKGRGKVFKLKFRNSAADQPFGMYRFVLCVKPGGTRIP